jgi:xanthine/CO dehydrogenase XdhC/CoxF family maturation factor
MKEIKAIIDTYDTIDKEKTKAALATVVRVEGSSYRRTGARMLVMDDGVWVGGISGGCLEGDALKRARFAISRSESTLITYDTTEDDEHQIGVGLGCNGIIDVLFTPIDYNAKKNPVEILKTCMESRRKTHILITITGLKNISLDNLKAGDVIEYDGLESLTHLQNEDIIKQIYDAVENQILIGKSAPLKFNLENGGRLEVFIEILPPEIHLILMGNQYDVYPLTRLVKEMGWRVTIVANPLKVNSKISRIADEIVLPDNFTDLLFDNHTAIVLMSHDYKTDKYNLPIALKTDVPFIGMLGPRVRSEKIFTELMAEGINISENNFERIHAPVGLDIGAVSPEEIALSLIAEIRASFSNRDGHFLRLRQTTIHERDK